MEEKTTLEQLSIGKCATVKSLEIEGIKRRRLQDLGFIEGSRIEAVYQSPAGNPVAYLIRGRYWRCAERMQKIQITPETKIGG